MKCRRHALPTADQAALSAELAAALRRGELCVLPTETVYGFALRPDDRALAALRAIKGRAAHQPLTWHLAAADSARDLADLRDPRVVRLVERYWPGPLTLVVPSARDRSLHTGLRVPAHDFTRAVIDASDGLLWMTSVNRSGEPPLCEPDAIAAAFGDSIAHLVDDGPSPLGSASTVVRCTGAELEVLREGILSRAEVVAAAAATVVFVCTGNTCRSPIAEAAARRVMAEQLGVSSDALTARGLAFTSAGTGTLDGQPASDNGRLAAAEHDLDLSAHRSRSLDPELLAQADRVYALSASHVDAILATMPEAADKVTLLRPDGGDIADPFGGDLGRYRAARDEIEVAVLSRIDEWRQLLPAAAAS